MRIDNKAWKTIFESNFAEGKYLYHFTDIEKVIKIIYGDSLKFSKISTTNDTLEAKPKMGVTSRHERTFFDFLNHLAEINKRYIQILCFTKDISPNITGGASGKKMYTDYSGRGFALPRMWAQYAKNNTGVCLVFNKEMLTNLIQESLGIGLIHHDSVRYVGKFENYSISPTKLNRLITQINEYQSDIQKSFIDLNFLKNNIEFVEYNYFSKLDDWAGENEYRFMTYGEDDYYIKGIKDALVGVVVGESIDPANEALIKILCQEICEIKKITFTYKGCQISSVI